MASSAAILSRSVLSLVVNCCSIDSTALASSARCARIALSRRAISVSFSAIFLCCPDQWSSKWFGKPYLGLAVWTRNGWFVHVENPPLQYVLLGPARPHVEARPSMAVDQRTAAILAA